jgi:3-oxoacyl-[acyl-carrier-protein] synthase-3
MKALKNAYLQVAIGEKRNAISVASELGSRIFKSTRYDERHLLAQDGSLPTGSRLSAYMLSDGAGAAVIENAPAASGISLRIDWISLTSFANTEKTCMYAAATPIRP